MVRDDMTTRQFHSSVEPRSGALQCGLASRRCSGLRRCGFRGSRLGCAVVVAGVLVASVVPWITGCGPEEAAGEFSPKPTPTVLVQPKLDEPREARPDPVAAGKRSGTLPSYDLPFEARANPFEPPGAGANTSPTNATSVRPADVKLLGLMRNGKDLMAAIEVFGNPSLVVKGARLESSDSADELYVREIRESEIVVEQGGRRWIVPLPRPEPLHTTQPVPASESLPVLNGRQENS